MAEPEFKKLDVVVHRKSGRRGQVVERLGMYMESTMYLVRFFDDDGTLTMEPGGGKVVASWDLRMVEGKLDNGTSETPHNGTT